MGDWGSWLIDNWDEMGGTKNGDIKQSNEVLIVPEWNGNLSNISFITSLVSGLNRTRVEWKHELPDDIIKSELWS